MAKEKKEELTEKKKKISYETELALIGVMLAIICLIGLLNQGYFGSIITYALVFVFGSWYYVVLLSGIYLGGYLIFKRKKPKPKSTLSVIAFAFLIVFLAIASSKYDDASLANWYPYYKNAFARTSEGVHVVVSRVNQVGGGLIGYSLYALLTSLLGKIVSNVVIVILILVFAYLAFRHPIIYLSEKVIKLYEKSQEKKKSKNKPDSVAVKQVVKEETKNVQTEVKKEQTHFLSYDIFTEKIFDEEEVTIEPTSFNYNNFSSPSFEQNGDIEDKESEVNDDSELVKEQESEETYQTDNTDEVEQSYQDNIFEYEQPIQDNNAIPEYEIVNQEELTANQIESEQTLKSDELADEYSKDVKEEKIIEEPEVISYKETASKDVQIPQYIEQENSAPYIVKEEKAAFNVLRVENLYSLLDDNFSNNASDELKDEVENNCLRINQKLEELNIKARVSNYIIGPCVTRYEIVPEIGVRVSSIVNIQNDLKLALAAVNLRMEAPIPGKSAVGVEVANKKRYPVYLKEVLESKKDIDDKLLVAIGKDLNNNPITISIDKMPHLLIAGATGSGKSVCINAIIMSLIIRATPDEVKMILVDPKKVEMLPYANMPHLLCPVVTDPKKASNALKKVVTEMDRRYDLFASNGVRNIESYNKLEDKEKLCKIVVIIDELADLMLVASKEVEESIQRITQLARAAGIYLIVATQRPSVDVITGVIKANIPSRIAFSVSSMVDSRTILDRAGAEDLLGKGDMLMDISGSGSLNRVQGVFVKDEEIFKVVEQVKMKYDVNFDEEFMNLEDDKKEIINNLNEVGDNNYEDELYNEIKSFVIQNQKASTSLLQRYFSLGYARAARMMDRLERDGIVSQSNGIRPREILVKEDELNDENN